MTRSSLASIRSSASVGSIESVASFGSIRGFASAGSILSIGSAGSLLSIGSAGSILSVGSEGRILHRNDRRMTAGEAVGHAAAITAVGVGTGALVVAVLQTLRRWTS